MLYSISLTLRVDKVSFGSTTGSIIHSSRKIMIVREISGLGKHPLRPRERVVYLPIFGAVLI